MQSLKILLTAALVGAAIPALGVSIASAQTCACPTGDEGAAPRASRVDIIADEAPPPLPDYEQPPLPAAGNIWTPGYWAWNSYEYYWVPGTWVAPPRTGYLWTPGYWGYVDGEYAFHRGYWGERVGFYGGVAYGFGYSGAGFVGGRWDGDHYFYNRTVNNFGTVNITNVYEQPAPRMSERASFNGGPEGIHAKPTPAELAAAKQSHLPPTTEQRQNARVASRTESAFVSTNQGKPPVAATAKPGELKGAAVVPAKAAGGPLPEKKPETPLPSAAKTEGGKPLLDTAPKGEPAGGAEPELRKKDEKTGKIEPDAKGETTPEKPKNERERRKPDDAKPELRDTKSETDQAKPDEPKAEKPSIEREHKKPADTDARPDKPKTELERPKPSPEPRAERPRNEMERARPPEPEPKADKPRTEMERPRPPAPAAGPRPEPPKAAEHREGGPKCAHPGEPNCPK